MDIVNFKEYIRLGDKFPSTIDVEPIEGNVINGVIAICYTYRSDKQQGYLQLRRHYSGGRVGLFVFAFDDANVPADWKDSVVIWDSRKHTECGARE